MSELAWALVAWLLVGIAWAVGEERVRRHISPKPPFLWRAVVVTVLLAPVQTVGAVFLSLGIGFTKVGETWLGALHRFARSVGRLERR